MQTDKHEETKRLVLDAIDEIRSNEGGKAIITAIKLMEITSLHEPPFINRTYWKFGIMICGRENMVNLVMLKWTLVPLKMKQSFCLKQNYRALRRHFPMQTLTSKIFGNKLKTRHSVTGSIAKTFVSGKKSKNCLLAKSLLCNLKCLHVAFKFTK